MNDIEKELNSLREEIFNLNEFKLKTENKLLMQSETIFGMFTALCVDTVDPWKQNRVRFFSPFLHRPDTPINALPFAFPISAAGGFDDCGMTWVPPAGSTVAIVFESGSRNAPYYIGTTWHRDRGPDGKHNWGFNIDEYYKIHEGHRKGFLIGPNDGSQVLPPWNTENYNGNDIDSIVDFENDPEAQRKITTANIYGLKTVEKHMWKNVDGDPKCNHKHKRMEFLSSCGNYMIFKDDHLHNSGSWTHPNCGATGPELDCSDANGNPIEKTDCEGSSSNSSILGGHPANPKNLKSNQGSNPYFKNANECRPYKGVGTPQNNKIELPQSGIGFLSISGQKFIMDDSVEEPRGIPNWERSLQPFDFGCNDKFLGKIQLISATGYEFTMSDMESQSKLRGEDSFIRLLTPTGIRIELNDHTVGSEGCPGCPPNLAGSKRGATIETSSGHRFEMLDEGNEQCSPCRTGGGVPTPKSKKAHIKLRSGYGIEVLISDQGSQEETVSQHFQISCPQKDNKERGQHILRMQEKPSGPGSVFLRVGGNYICSTYDNHYTVVGSEKNPSNKITSVSLHTLIQTKQFYFNAAEIHAFLAKKYILLMAGQDCPPPPGGTENGPCVWPVLCLSNNGITISDRVFVSASQGAQTAHILQLLPFFGANNGTDTGD